MRSGWRALLCFSLAATGAGTVLAHKGSDAYLDVQQVSDAAPDPTQRDYRFALAVAIKDLDQILPLDANADGKVTWGEVKVATPSVLALLNEAANTEPLAGLPAAAALAGSTAASPCHLDWKFDGLERRSDGTYLRVRAQARCPQGQALAFNYTLFKEQDASHRLLIAGRIADQDLLTTARPQQSASLVLSAGAGSVSGIASGSAAATDTRPSSSRRAALQDYFAMGVRHLLEGYDHLAFLLALVLPLRLRLGRAKPLEQADLEARGNAPGSGVWWALLRTVTAFTIGHSITLVLATLGWTQAAPSWVEPVIALSIAVTALLNLRPLPWLRTDVLALLFGMVHGYGFAGLLLEAAAPSGLLPWALAGFNVGIEAGQLIAVSIWVVLSQALVSRTWYHRVVVRGGSALLVLVALWWFWQRVS